MIDPNIVFQGIGGQYTSYPQAEAQNTQNAIADQSLQQQKIATEQAQRALAAQKLLSDLLRKHTTIAGGDSGQSSQDGGTQQQGAAPQSAPQQQQSTSDQTDNTIHSASLGTDAYGNIIPKVGAESPATPSGDFSAVPDNMTGPPNTLANAANAPLPTPAGVSAYQAAASAPAADTTGDNSQPQAEANSLQAAASPSTQPAASTAGPAASTPAPATTVPPRPYQAPTLMPGYRGPVTDWDAVTRELTAAGYGPEALKLDAERRAQMVAALNMQEKQLEMQGKRMAQMGSYAASVPTVNWKETDPGIRQTQVNAAQVAAITAVKQMGANGLMDPAHVGALLGELSKGYTPQIEGEIQQFAHEAMTSAEQHSAHIADLNAQREMILNGLNVRDKQANAERVERQNAAARMAQATTPEAWAQQYNALPANLKPYFDDPAHFDPKTSPQKAMMSGMSEQGMGNYLNRQTQIQNSQEYQQERLQDQRDWRAQQAGFRQQMLDMEKNRESDRQAGKKTGNAQAVSEINALQNREQQLHNQRTLLSNAFQSGATYIDKSGRSIPMDQYTRYADDKDAAKQAAIEDMKERYGVATDEVKNVIQRKNDIALGQGWQPSVSTADAWKAIDHPNNQNKPPSPTPNPVPKAAAPAKAPAPAAKPATPQPANSQAWIKQLPNFGKSITEPRSKVTLVVGKTYNSPSGPVVFTGFSADGKAQTRSLNQ